MGRAFHARAVSLAAFVVAALSTPGRAHHAARAELRQAILRARNKLSWKEVLRVLAECPVEDDNATKPPLPKRSKADGA